MSIEKITNEWKKKAFKPVYWLEGEESYFIDRLTGYAENSILSPAEAEFNLTIFYGRDADWASVINACRRYPMFAEKQVVLLKEAQQMKEIDRLEGYVQNPLASTIFVVAFKEKKLDGRGSFAKLVKQGGYLLSEKIKDYQLAEWVAEMIREKGLTINTKALALIVDHIGNDLSRLQNEVEKLTINLKSRKNITEDDIEEFIGISKEFNVFELQDAVAKKDLTKAIRIIQYFSSSPKAGPIQLILPTFYNYFSKVYAVLGMENKTEQHVKSLFYNNSFAAKQALQTCAAYGFRGIEKTLLLLQHYNLRSVGVNDSGTEDAELMKELVIKMMQD